MARTEEQVKAALDKAVAEIKDGASIDETVKRHGFTRSRYYFLRKKHYGGKTKKKPKAVTYQSMPFAGPADGDFELRGSPESIARFIKAMGSQYGANQ